MVHAAAAKAASLYYQRLILPISYLLVLLFRMPDASRRDQNIPVTAITESVRDPQFTREEWDQVRTPARSRVR